MNDNGTKSRQVMKISSYGITSEQLYGLKLGETICNGIEIMRVPGGWIFMMGHGMAFVPYDNEFDQLPPRDQEIPFP